MTAHGAEDAADRDLVRRIGRGDDGALRALFRRYGAVANALALRVVRRPSVAEEAVQEAFIALWRTPGAFHPDGGSVRTWLLSAVHDRAVDVIRGIEASRRRGPAPNRSDPLEEDVGGVGVGKAAADVGRAAARAALAGLPSEQREALELMYFDGLTQSQVAADLGVPLGTVKGRTLLAMRRLRVVVAPEDGP